MQLFGSLGVALALVSAMTWGCADFLGGWASRRASQFHVVALSAFSGIVMLVLLSVLTGEKVPASSSVAWAGAAGVAGVIGLASLYRGLAIGSAATVAPTAAVLTAAIPVLFGAVTAGLPRASQLAGFGCAVAGIWLVARPPVKHDAANTGLPHALLAGAGFGLFLVLLGQVPSTIVFAPLAIARMSMLLAALGIVISRRMPMPSIAGNPIALAAGLLDAGGNVFFMFARQNTRFDVAAVLSSLYPVATVLLARVVTKDPISRTQWIGVVICLVAVALIT
jgi:drug/metabolite transporter (DMT)-like permease